MKKVLLGLSALLVGVVLVGCDSDSTETEASEPETTEVVEETETEDEVEDAEVAFEVNEDALQAELEDLTTFRDFLDWQANLPPEISLQPLISDQRGNLLPSLNSLEDDDIEALLEENIYYARLDYHPDSDTVNLVTVMFIVYVRSNDTEEEYTISEMGLIQATVTNIVDGDTIDVDIDGTIERVRFIGIDTPERGEIGFEEATNFTRDRIAEVDNIVWLESSGNDRDRFERLRRYIWLGVPTDASDVEQRSALLLNQMLLDAGHAIVFGAEDEAAAVEPESIEPQEHCGQYGCIAVIPEAPTNFQNCTAMREWYPSGVPEGHPAFASRHDRDNDGWACE